MREWLKFRSQDQVPKWQKILYVLIEIGGTFIFCIVLYFQGRK
jgi:hypothetical protein